MTQEIIKPDTAPLPTTKSVNTDPTGFLKKGFWSLLILVFGLGGWASFAQIQGAVIGVGQVIVETKPKIIQHLDGGIVGDIPVKEGDVVNAGDLLMRLDATQLDSGQTIVQTRFFESQAQFDRLQSERDGLETITWSDELTRRAGDPVIQRAIDGQTKLFDARQKAMNGNIGQLRERISQYQEQIAGLRSLISSNQTQVELIKGEVDDLREGLAKGVVSRSRFNSFLREQARLEGDISSRRAEVARVQGTISEIRLQIIQIEREFQEAVLTELREVQVKVNDLREEMVVNEDKLMRIDIRSPVDGVVHNMSMTTTGGVVGPGQEIMEIIPRNDRLIVEARVQTQDIDQIFEQQPSTVRFSAFNQRKTPELNAHVTNISADSLIDELTGFPYFNVKVEISAQELDRLNGLQLLPGMPAEVFFTTQPRSVMSYLLKPLTDSMQRSFREE